MMTPPAEDEVDMALRQLLLGYSHPSLLSNHSVKPNERDGRSQLRNALTDQNVSNDFWKSAENPFEHPPSGACGTMLMMAGMARSGSTWQRQLVESALKYLDVSYVDGGYWDFPQHVHHSVEEARKEYKERRQFLEGLSNDSIILYKSHEFVPKAINLCRKTIVFTCHRCVEGAILSAAGLGWTDLNNASYIAERLSKSIDNYAAWKQFGALDIDYDVSKEQPMQTLQLIVDYLALHLDVSAKKYDKRGALVREDEASLSLPSSREAGSSSGNIEITRDVVAAMQEVRELLRDTPHDPIKHGLRWCDTK
jgi:hypothetical protein